MQSSLDIKISHSPGLFNTEKTVGKMRVSLRKDFFTGSLSQKKCIETIRIFEDISVYK
jgi:hypothetical protein